MFFGGDPFDHFGHGGGRSHRGSRGGGGGGAAVDTTKLYETLGVRFIGMSSLLRHHEFPISNAA
jgi:hypothetical protein